MGNMKSINLFLTLTFLVSLIHLPTSRSVRLTRVMQATPDSFQGWEKKAEMAAGVNLEEMDFNLRRRRMDVELHDYPGAGTNNKLIPIGH